MSKSKQINKKKKQIKVGGFLEKSHAKRLSTEGLFRKKPSKKIGCEPNYRPSPPSAKLINFYDIIDEKYIPKYKQKHFLGPEHPFRMVVTGPSGAGKTNIVMNIITKLTYFDKLYLYAKKLDEPLYKWLIDDFEEDLEKSAKAHMQKLTKNRLPGDTDIAKFKEKNRILTYSSDLKDVIQPDALDEKLQNLIIVDDMITESASSQKIIEELYIRGRKNNASIIYITQNYHETPKNIRKNANYFAIVKIDNKREMLELQKDHASRVSKDEFMKIVHNIQDQNSKQYAQTGKIGNNFLLIDKKTDHLPLHLRMNFDMFYCP